MQTRFVLRLSKDATTPAIDLLIADGSVGEAGTSLRLPGHTPTLAPAQEAKVAAFVARLEASPFAPPTDQPLEPELLSYLLQSSRVVRVGEDIVFPAGTYNEAVARIRAALEEQGAITVAQVRDLFGTSRKYALALLEHLDDIKVTRRVGDERRLNR
jgi:selenocysteine-specific elongation factor